ncbi:MAG: 7-cyano-7-deazaguanine synthase, partial [Cyanobacteria bacterium P01_H01_bin.35]
MNERISSSQKNKSDRCDYIFNFGPISNKNGTVQFIDRSKGKESKVDINVNDQDFAYGVRKKFPTIVADIVDLAVAIHASDRLAPHNLDQNQRHLHVVLPVRHPELLNAELFLTKLKELLYWTTGSEWMFDFQKRKALGRLVEKQFLEKQLISPITPQESEVTLWSGGLDALAGLYTRLQMHPGKSFILCGSSSHNNVYSRQAKVAQSVQSIFPNRCYPRRVRILFNNSKEHHKNKLSRGRGVVFTLLGAACAYLMGSQVLSVYENGVGAINLPYSASSIGLDHSRNVHPLTLLMVSDVISELLGEKFQVKNPFLFWTKGEMCQALAKDNRIDLPPITMSCDSPHRQQPIQCGYCSSCILRKQS